MNDVRTIDNDTLLGEICILLSEGKRVKLRAKGGSMSPFINGGEDNLVLAQRNSLRTGDIVLARIEGKRYVMHRIVCMKDGGITLMGDANLYETEECSRSDIFGTVESVIRNGQEHGIMSPYARLKARAWRFLLPLRRLNVRISNRIIRK